jgi:hypothetical protein
MKTARRRTSKLPGSPARQPSTWRGRSEQILLNQLGCEARKIAAMGEIFFLTSTFIELPRHLDYFRAGHSEIAPLTAIRG